MEAFTLLLPSSQPQQVIIFTSFMGILPVFYNYQKPTLLHTVLHLLFLPHPGDLFLLVHRQLPHSLYSCLVYYCMDRP